MLFLKSQLPLQMVPSSALSLTGEAANAFPDIVKLSVDL